MARERTQQYTAAKHIILDAADNADLLQKVAGRVASFSFLNVDSDTVHAALVSMIALQMLRVTIPSEDEILEHIKEYEAANPSAAKAAE